MPAAIAVTFDNLGEAAELERGQWPSEAPLGRHFSVTRGLPRVLGLLGELELRATFFVEGINAELYPEVLRDLEAAGHEVALHGWRHEVWSELDAAAERDLLARSVAALNEVGLRPVGFRPPGGRLTASSAGLLTDAGFAYCSPAGDGAGMLGDLAVLPFRWELIDAFHYLPSFAGRRAALGSPGPLPPAALRVSAGGALAQASSDDAFLALLFHPFLADSDERLDTMRAVLADVRVAVCEQDVWCAPMRELAAWMREQEDAPTWPVSLDPR